MKNIFNRFSILQSQFSTPRGFTLIEIILVMALIGIMATLIISLIDPVAQFKKARDVQRKTDLRQIQSALDLYRADNQKYPDTSSFPACGSQFASGTAVYMKKVPCDPKNTGQFKYTYVGSAMSYTLTACLENVNDQQKEQPNNATYCTGGTTNWSYSVANP